MTRRIDVTVALDGGCWFAHRSDRPDDGPDRNGWVLVDAEVGHDDHPSPWVLRAYMEGQGFGVRAWRPVYTGRVLAHAVVGGASEVADG